ncbi:MAG: hypothetical protein NVSMB46_06430 [Candidatus Saccharimonadales bacterium]
MITLRRFNNILSILLIILVAYVLASPIIGNVSFYLHKKFQKNHGYVYKTRLQTNQNSHDELKNIPKDNRIVIPTMNLDLPIREGKSPYTLSKGLWHAPDTGNPLLGGNMVILGHRFTYNGPSYLFNLDKVKIGDKYSVYWQQKEYIYEVKNITIVSPYDLSIIAPTAKPRITIYTCTPLWTSKQRLVVQSELVEY